MSVNGGISDMSAVGGVFTATSQRAQIVRYVAKFPDHFGIAEIARSRITRAAKCDRTNVAFLARKRLGAHHDRDRIEAFGWLTSGHAVVTGAEG
jgi:hypothetical protein